MPDVTTPEVELKSVLRCPTHTRAGLYYDYKNGQYIHYYCKSGAHWVALPLAEKDEVR